MLKSHSRSLDFPWWSRQVGFTQKGSFHCTCQAHWNIRTFQSACALNRVPTSMVCSWLGLVGTTTICALRIPSPRHVFVQDRRATYSEATVYWLNAKRVNFHTLRLLRWIMVKMYENCMNDEMICDEKRTPSLLGFSNLQVLWDEMSPVWLKPVMDLQIGCRFVRKTHRGWCKSLSKLSTYSYHSTYSNLSFVNLCR